MCRPVDKWVLDNKNLGIFLVIWPCSARAIMGQTQKVIREILWIKKDRYYSLQMSETSQTLGHGYDTLDYRCAGVCARVETQGQDRGYCQGQRWATRVSAMPQTNGLQKSHWGYEKVVSN